MTRHFETKESLTAESFAEYVAGLYLGASEKFLKPEDPLRKRLDQYFSVNGSSRSELVGYFERNSSEEVYKSIEHAEVVSKDLVRFIEGWERFFEKQAVTTARWELYANPRLATEAEYEMGCYVEFLESQVRDAVLVLQNKGYKTFQSGFEEKEGRRGQFIDFYNKDIFVPDHIKNYLKEKGVSLEVTKGSNRTTLTLVPPDRLVRLDEWKEVWDYVAGELPKAVTEMMDNALFYEDHTEFRILQDRLKQEMLDIEDS